MVHYEVGEEYPVSDYEKSKMRPGIKVYYNVCYIKKLFFGGYRVEFKDTVLNCTTEEDQKPDVRLILYPNGIEEIKYSLKK